MATIKDVARLACVDISTVSRALSGKVPVEQSTKERVLEAARQLNYQPNALAKGLKEGKTNTIGLIVPNIDDTVFTAVAKGVEDAARKLGYTLILCNTNEDIKIELDYVDKLKRRFVDGFIFATATKKSEHIIKLKEENFPVMLVIREMNNLCDAVVVNNNDGAYEATSFLISKGCKNIAFLNGDIEISLYKERMEGYKKALLDNNIPVDEDIIIHGIYGGYKSGYGAMNKLLDRNKKIDGVFASTDPRAIGAIRCIKDRNLKVPEDIKVVGFVGLESAEMTDPPLTTITQPTYEMGVRAVERLIKLINNKKKAKPLVERLDVKLTVRKST